MSLLPKDTIKIEKVGAESAALLSALQKECYQPQGENFWSVDSFADSLASLGTTAKIICLKGEPVGFAVTRHVADEMEVMTIGVLSSYRGHGFGSYLLKACLREAEAMDADKAYLEVREDNSSAIYVYEQHGFIQTGRRKNYYTLLNGKRVDALTFSLTLK